MCRLQISPKFHLFDSHRLHHFSLFLLENISAAGNRLGLSNPTRAFP